YAVIAPPPDKEAAYGVTMPGLRARLNAVHPDYFDVNDGRISGLDYNLWYDFQMSPDEFLATLKYTLDLRLQGNRAPMAFGTHTMYYAPEFDVLPPRAMDLTQRQTALESFIDYALSKQEVRMVAMKELLDWMRNPQPLP